MATRTDHHPTAVATPPRAVRVTAEARLPTRYGLFRLVAFEGFSDGKEHVALVRGDVAGARDLLVRVHSECLTGDAFGSLRCDCRAQLEASLRKIARLDRGIVLYLRQEGRGIGLVNKVRAYALQERGMDTLEANEALGFGADERDYSVAAEMLAALGVESVSVLSNNPAKIRDLEQHGVRVIEREPIETHPNAHNRFYLETKRRKAGHLLRSWAPSRRADNVALPMPRPLLSPPRETAPT